MPSTQETIFEYYPGWLAFARHLTIIHVTKGCRGVPGQLCQRDCYYYYQWVLHLLPDDQRVGGLLKLGQVFELVGEWENAERINREADRLAVQLNDVPRHARAQRALGWLLRKRGAYTEAEEWLVRAREGYQQLNDTAGLSHVLSNISEIYRLQGKL